MENVTPIFAEYRTVTRRIRQKQAERKRLEQERKDSSALSPARRRRLNGQITMMTEEIEELKNRQAQLMHEMDCHTAGEMKSEEAKFDRTRPSRASDAVDRRLGEDPKAYQEYAERQRRKKDAERQRAERPER